MTRDMEDSSGTRGPVVTKTKVVILEHVPSSEGRDPSELREAQVVPEAEGAKQNLSKVELAINRDSITLKLYLKENGCVDITVPRFRNLRTPLRSDIQERQKASSMDIKVENASANGKGCVYKVYKVERQERDAEDTTSGPAVSPTRAPPLSSASGLPKETDTDQILDRGSGEAPASTSMDPDNLLTIRNVEPDDWDVSHLLRPATHED